MTEYTTKAANTNEPAEQAYTPNAGEESSVASESFAMNHAGFSAIQAQLAAEGLGILDGEALAPEGQAEAFERPLYLGTPVSAGESEGIDVADLTESTTDDTPNEEPVVTAPSCPVLGAQDRELIARIRELGNAATLPEVAAHFGASIDRLAGGDFAGNGAAFYREHRGHTLIALAGATEGDLAKAANRAEAERIGERFERSAATAEAMKRDLMVRLDSLGGASSLDGAKRALAAAGYPREAIRPVLAERRERGWIRVSVRGKAPEAVQEGQRDTRTRFITLANAAEGALANAARRHAADQAEIPSRRAEAADNARRRGQDKAFAAPVVPFGGTRVSPAEQARALYIERAKAAYHDLHNADPKGLYEATLRLKATDTLPAEEVTLYTAEPDGAREFFTARLKARILTGLVRNGHLTGRRILAALFPAKAAEISAFLAAGRELSPTLAEPYSLFTAAINELAAEGRVARTRKGLVLAKPGEQAATAATTRATDRADQAPEPERQSGPDAHGRDRYAADMPGAHDHRRLASGPQAPSTRPAQRRKSASRIRAAIGESRKASAAKGGNTASGNPEATLSPEASLAKAQCNQAWNEARARYMRTLDSEDRLELYLQLEGEKRLERMVEAAGEPNELYRAMIVLKDEGRIQVRQSGGYTLISAAGELDREELAAELVELMARVGSREIYVPEGTALHTRVAAVEAAREQTSRLSRAAQPAVA